MEKSCLLSEINNKILNDMLSENRNEHHEIKASNEKKGLCVGGSAHASS